MEWRIQVAARAYSAFDGGKKNHKRGEGGSCPTSGKGNFKADFFFLLLLFFFFYYYFVSLIHPG